MSRRSSRRAPKKIAAASLPAGVLTGLKSLVEGNEATVAQMLSVSDLPPGAAEAQTQLVTSLTDCMGMNDLSAEALLARFFDASMLRKYREDRLGVSGKGNEATLAARIARVWAKSNFEPLPVTNANGTARKGGSKKKPKRRADDVDANAKKKAAKTSADDN